MALSLLAVMGTASVAHAQDCTYKVLARFHYNAADGGDRACVVYQRTDCGVTTMCAG